MTKDKNKFSFKKEFSKRAMGPILKMFGKGDGLLEIIGQLEDDFRKGQIKKNGDVIKLEDEETIHLLLSDVQGKLRISFAALKMDKSFRILVTMEFEHFLLKATKMMK